MRVMKLLIPGLHIKRWLGLTLIGLVVLALGLAYLFVELYRTVALPMEAATTTRLTSAIPSSTTSTCHHSRPRSTRALGARCRPT